MQTWLLRPGKCSFFMASENFQNKENRLFLVSKGPPSRQQDNEKRKKYLPEVLWVGQSPATITTSLSSTFPVCDRLVCSLALLLPLGNALSSH